jgi:small subunit ribosomal protein S16
MAVKIRLARHGSKKAPFYRIVVADARSPRDGAFIDRVGTYNPRTNPSEISVDTEKAKEWLSKGAQPTNQVRSILKISGVL